MRYVELSAEQRRSFDDNGYLIVRDAIDPESLARFAAACDRLVAARHRDSGERRASLTNVVADEPELLPLLTWHTTVPLVVQLLSHNIHLTKSHLIYKYPDPPTAEQPTYWHRDIANSSEDLGLHANTRMEIKIAYHFSDCLTPGCGNTWLAPGSNNLDRPLDLVPGSTDPAGAIEPELQAGDAFLFENRTFHRQGLNLTARTRKVLMMGYSYAWLSPNDYIVQDREFLDRVQEPIELQLLGALRTSNTQIDDGPLRAWALRHSVRRASEVAAAAGVSAGAAGESPAAKDL